MKKQNSKNKLSEKKHSIIEQANVKQKQPTNLLTDQELLGNTSRLRSLIQSGSDFGSILGVPNLDDMFGVNWANIIAGRRTGVKGVVDALDGWVDEKDLAYVLASVKILDGKCWYDDIENITLPAITRFLQLYKEDENGDDLIQDVNGVGIRTLPTGSDRIKKRIVAEINKQQQNIAACSASSQTTTTGSTENQKKAPQKSKYFACSTFPFKLNCKSEIIRQIQTAILLPEKYRTSYFGPITLDGLKKFVEREKFAPEDYDGLSKNPPEISKELYDSIMRFQQKLENPTKIETPKTPGVPVDKVNPAAEKEKMIQENVDKIKDMFKRIL